MKRKFGYYEDQNYLAHISLASFNHLNFLLRHLERSQVDKTRNKIVELRTTEVLLQRRLSMIGHGMTKRRTNAADVRPTLDWFVKLAPHLSVISLL